MNSSTLTIYRKLYEDANEDMDAFFQMANELPGVKGESLKKGRVYHLTFLECTCNFCKKGMLLRLYSANACVRRHLFHAKPLKDLKFNFTLCHFVLQGG